MEEDHAFTERNNRVATLIPETGKDKGEAEGGMGRRGREGGRRDKMKGRGGTEDGGREIER